MSAVLNEENNYEEILSVKTSSAAVAARPINAAKISRTLCLAFALGAAILLFVSVWETILFWNFTLLAATLCVFGFLERNAGNTRLGTFVWAVSLVWLVLLFIFGFGSFETPQAFYFYAAFSMVVPILLVIAALVAKKASAQTALAPLAVIAFFIASSVMATFGTSLSLLLLPFGWAIFGWLSHPKPKEN